MSCSPEISNRDSLAPVLKFSARLSETGPMHDLLLSLGLSPDSVWTWVGVIALGLIVVQVFLDAAAPRKSR